MNEIKAVVFDLGMVLIPFNYDFALNRLNLLKPGSGEKVMEFVRENYHYFRAFEAGKLTTEEFIPMLMKAGEVEDLLSIDEFCFIYSEIFSINYDVAELLSRLKQNYRLFLLSNTNPVHRKYGYENFKFFRHFEKLFYSDEVGHVKPAPEIYQAVEKYSGLKPEEHLFIDDIFEYAEGARNCDWKAIQFFTYDQLLKELRVMGFHRVQRRKPITRNFLPTTSSLKSCVLWVFFSEHDEKRYSRRDTMVTMKVLSL